jgi:polysaccharide export outer membrane protein
MTLSQLISIAGGFTQMAARQKVRIQRTVAERTQVVEVDMTAIYEGRAPNQFIEAGDEIFVPERLF